MKHIVSVLKRKPNGYYIAKCSCGWTYGPDTEYQVRDEAERHREAA